MIQQLDLFAQTFSESLPLKVYCGDTPEGQVIRPKRTALGKLLIQPNHPTLTRHLVYDVDTPTARWDWDETNCPAPTWLAVNRENGHAHLGYTLENPVYWTPSETPATRYLSAVDVALTAKLGADPAYNKHLTKNPIRSDFWWVEVFQKHPYTMDWLADYLDLEPYRDQRKNLPAIGYGRNCTLFDRLRHWAYPRVRKSPSLRVWLLTLTDKAEGYNDFEIPLQRKEVQGIAKSVGTWTWENIEAEPGKGLWGQATRAKSLEVRQARAEELKAQILAVKAVSPCLSNRAVARIVGCDEKLVRLHLA